MSPGTAIRCATAAVLAPLAPPVAPQPCVAFCGSHPRFPSNRPSISLRPPPRRVLRYDRRRLGHACAPGRVLGSENHPFPDATAQPPAFALQVRAVALQPRGATRQRRMRRYSPCPTRCNRGRLRRNRRPCATAAHNQVRQGRSSAYRRRAIGVQELGPSDGDGVADEARAPGTGTPGDGPNFAFCRHAAHGAPPCAGGDPRQPGQPPASPAVPRPYPLVLSCSSIDAETRASIQNGVGLLSRPQRILRTPFAMACFSNRCQQEARVPGREENCFAGGWHRSPFAQPPPPPPWSPCGEGGLGWGCPTCRAGGGGVQPQHTWLKMTPTSR